MKILVFDIGGTYVKWGIVNTEDWTIIKDDKYPAQAFEKKGTGIINDLIIKIKEIRESNTIDGVAISIPGAVNTEKGIIIGATDNIPESQNLNVKDMVSNIIADLPIIVSNDVNFATMGELANGNLKGIKNGLMITLGTGIGGGIIINSKLYEGHSSLASEFGRMFINDQKWEDTTSVSQLIEETEKHFPEISTGEKLFSELVNNPALLKIYNKWLSRVAKGIANLVVSFNPEVIVIGGGITEEDKFDVNFIKSKMLDYIPIEFAESVTLKKAALGNGAALIGGAYLLLHNI